MTFQPLQAFHCLDAAQGMTRFSPDLIAVGSSFPSAIGNAGFYHPREEMAESRSGTAESWDSFTFVPLAALVTATTLQEQTPLCQQQQQPAWLSRAWAAWPCCSLGHVLCFIWMATKAAQVLSVQVVFCFQPLKIHSSELRPLVPKSCYPLIKEYKRHSCSTWMLPTFNGMTVDNKWLLSFILRASSSPCLSCHSLYG